MLKRRLISHAYRRLTLVVVWLLTVVGCSSVVDPGGATEGSIVAGGDPSGVTAEDSGDYVDPESPTDPAEFAAQFETEVLGLVNAQRAAGADCGSAGLFEPAPALTMNSTLADVARAHSTDMADREFFDHTNPDGESPGDRVAAAGYSALAWGENIAFGQTSPGQVVDAWMASSGHCANIMRSTYTEIGIGYHENNLWTQVFAAPAGP